MRTGCSSAAGCRSWASCRARDIHAPWQVPAESWREAGIELGRDYPEPLVGHEEARERTLERFAVVKKAIPYDRVDGLPSRVRHNA